MEIAEAVGVAVPSSEASGYRCASGPVLIVRRESLAEVMRYLREEAEHSYDMLVDVTAVDHRARQGVFHVVYQLASLRYNRRLMVKVVVPGDDPVIASVTALWRSADWAEREVWDMFGIRFEAHPDLRRILLYEEFEGHPLRKDYPVDKRQPLVEERDPIADPWPSRDGR